MPFETWSGQFHLVHGEPAEFGPYAGVFHSAGSSAPGGELFVVCRPLNPALAPALVDLLPRFGAVFEREALSLTGALIRCVAVAHEQIRQWNQKALPAHRAGLAMAGLAIRGEQAYLALAGPAVSYLRRGDELRRITVPQEAAAPVGVGVPPEPDFTYFALRSGDVFLLTFSTIERMLDQQHILALICQRPDRTIAGLFEAAALEQEFAAIVVAVDPPEGTPIDLPPLPRHAAASAPVQPAPPSSRLAPRRRAADERQIAMFGASAAEAHAGRPPEAPPAPPPLAARPASAVPDAVAEAPAVERPHRPLAPVKAWAESPSVPDADAGEAAEEPLIPPAVEVPSLLEPPLPRGGMAETSPPVRGAEPSASAAPARAPRVIDDLANEAGHVGIDEAGGASSRQVEPEEAAERLRRVRQRPRYQASRPEAAAPGATSSLYEIGEEPLDLSPKIGLGRLTGPELRHRLRLKVSRRRLLAVIGAAAVVLLVVLAVVAIPRVLQENQEDRVRELVAQSQQLFDEAAAEQDPGLRREGLRGAQALVEEALGLRPEDPAARGLSLSIRAALGLLDGEVQMADLEEESGLQAILAAPGAAQESAIAGGQVFLLDGAAGKVVHFSLVDPTLVTTVLEAGVEVEGTAAAKPLHIAYMGAEGALLITSEGGSDYLYQPGNETELARVQIPGREAWQDVDALVWTNTQLLVVDLAAKVGHRYAYARGKFTTEGDISLGNALPTSVRSATWLDTLYLLDDKGILFRLGADGLARLEPSGLDRPLLSPQAISADAITRHIYVSDRGNNRVVVLDENGVFKQQLVSPELLSLSLVNVDARNQQIYLVAGDALYRASLPPVDAP